MNVNANGSLPPFIQTHAKVLERDAICIETLAVGSVYSNQLRSEVQYLTELDFLPSDLFLGALLFAQVEDEHDALVSTFKQRTSNQHGHAAAIFPKKLLLVRLHSPGGLQARHGMFVA